MVTGMRCYYETGALDNGYKIQFVLRDKNLGEVETPWVRIHLTLSGSEIGFFLRVW